MAYGTTITNTASEPMLRASAKHKKPRKKNSNITN